MDLASNVLFPLRKLTQYFPLFAPEKTLYLHIFDAFLFISK